MNERTFRRWIVAIFLLGLLIRLGFLFLTPPLEVADGPAHFAYTSYIAEEGKLPVMKGPGTEFYQSPLYYMADAFVLRLLHAIFGSVPLLMMRLFDIALGMLTVYLTLVAARMLSENNAIRLGIVSFAALLPTLAFFNSHITNVNLEVLISTLGIVLILRYLGEKYASPKLLLFMGLCIGIAVLTRMSLTALVAVVGLAVLVKHARNGRRGLFSIMKDGGAILCIFLLISAPLFARNFTLYGDIFATNAVRAASLNDDEFRVSSLPLLFGKTFASFWAGFGLSNGVFLSLDYIRSVSEGFSSIKGALSFLGVYGLLLLLTLLAAVGIILHAVELMRRKGDEVERERKSLLVLGAYILLLGGVFLSLNTHDYQPQGKFFLASVFPFGVFFVLGVARVGKSHVSREAVVYGIIALLLALNVLAFMKLISTEGYASEADKCIRQLGGVSAHSIAMNPEGKFSYHRVKISAGESIYFSYNKEESPGWMLGQTREYILVFFRDGYYLSTKIIPEYGSVQYEFRDPGHYKVINANSIDRVGVDVS